MADATAISWTERTWNPWRGCTKVSKECDLCYMFTAQHKRQQQTGNFPLWNPEVVQRTTTWNDPLRWQKAAAAAGRVERVFTCSWSDWFHKDADQWRADAWEIIRRCPNLHFQILTKRAERMARQLPADWGDGYRNVWLGVSVGIKASLWRIDYLRKIPARVRFLSLEPLLEDLELEAKHLEGIHQAIAGGESGAGFRPMPHDWPKKIRDLCHSLPGVRYTLENGEYSRGDGIAFFFKQSAAFRTETGTTLDGREWKEYPLDLRDEAERLHSLPSNLF